MKKSLCLLLLLLTCFGVFAEKGKVKLTGVIKGLGTNQVEIIDMNRERVAACVSEKDKFEVEFNYDLDGNLRLGIYIPHIDDQGCPQSFNVYMFEADAAGVRVVGKIKGTKVEGFRAYSPVNDEYYKAKFETPSTPLRLKAEKETGKAWKALENYRDLMKKSKGVKNPDQDAKALALRQAVEQKQEIMSGYNLQGSMEALATLTPEMNTGLNAFIYATCNSLRYDLLKPVAEKYLSLYDKEVLENNFYTRELLKTYRVKAVRHAGNAIIDYDFVDLNGNIVKFSDLKGKYVYVNLYDLTYEPSMEELKHVLELQKKYQDKNIVFLHLNVNKDRNTWIEYCRKNHLTDNQVNINDKPEFFGVYKVNDLPRGILIDPLSRMHTFLVGKLYGEQDENGKNLNNGKTVEEVLEEVFKN